MLISVSSIENALRSADVESLLAIGAPSDEYAPEAEKIAAAWVALKPDQQTPENLIAIIGVVWAKMFNLTPSQTEQRLPTFTAIADELLIQPAN